MEVKVGGGNGFTAGRDARVLVATHHGHHVLGGGVVGGGVGFGTRSTSLRAAPSPLPASFSLFPYLGLALTLTGAGGGGDWEDRVFWREVPWAEYLPEERHGSWRHLRACVMCGIRDRHDISLA